MGYGPDLIERIKSLKKKKEAMILAHYYQDSRIQDLADVVGDSLELARVSRDAASKFIVFCGVHFMAEGAKILNPGAKVMIPDLKAGCSLSEGCPPEEFKKFLAKIDRPFVISYINCSAAIKSMSDVICTSSNAVKIVLKAPKDRTLVFAPDKNLGAWVKKQTGREMILWQGSCIVHETFSERKIIEQMEFNPDAELIAHPECEAPLLSRAHFIGSTSALLKYSQNSKAKKFIVATEEGILHQMKLKSPEKTFIPGLPTTSCSCNECPYMKLNTLEKIYDCLDHDANEILLDEDLRLRALAPLERMLQWSN